MKTLRRALIAMLFFCCSAWTAPLSAAGPTPQEKCPVCGMFVAKFPDWTASIRYQDGTQRFFDGAKDLFAAYLNPARYAPRKGGVVAGTISVKDYYSLKDTDARRAVFVIGSDVFGPMGKELIPFATEADARAFMKDHKGQRLLHFKDVTPQILKTLE